MPANKPPHQTPTPAEWGELRSYLARAGLGQDQIRAAIGEQSAGRTRAELAEALREWLRHRTRGSS